VPVINALCRMEDEEEEVLPPIQLTQLMKEKVPSFKSLVTALTCNICYDPFVNPVLTSCSHSFCSVCIRKYLVYKQQCPQCGSLTSDGQLRANKALGESAVLVRSLAAQVDRLAQNSVGTSTRVPGEDGCKTSANPNSHHLKVSPKKSTVNNENRPLEPIQHQSAAANGAALLTRLATFTPTAAKDKQVLTARVTDDNTMVVGGGEKELSRKTECVICKVLVPSKNLSLHMNSCLDRKAPEKPPGSNGRHPLPKLVYNLLKDAELKKRCKALGLSTKGDRRALISRHQKYTILHNSENHLDEPRPLSELVNQVHREEASENSTTNNFLLKFDRNTDARSIEEKQKQYLQINKNSFKQLVDKAKTLGCRSSQSTSPSTFTTSTVRSTSFQTPTTSKRATSSDSTDSLFSTSNQSNLKKLKPSVNDEDSNDSCIEILSEVVSKSALVTDKSAKTTDSGGSKSDKKCANAASSSRDNLTTEQQLDTSRTPVSKTSTGTCNDQGKKAHNTSIKESLALSVERCNKTVRQCCPVCHTLVVERYLNIHLDKCLRKNEPDPSPIIKKDRPKAVAKRKRGPKLFNVEESDFGSETTTTEDEEDEANKPWETPPHHKQGRSQRLIGNECDDESSSQDDETTVSSQIIIDDDDISAEQDSAHLVAEPSLADLISMGLGTGGSNTNQEEAENSDAANKSRTMIEEGEENSNGLDQYTETISQDSYSQGSRDMFCSSEDGSPRRRQSLAEEDTFEDEFDDNSEFDATLNQFFDARLDEIWEEERQKEESSSLTVTTVEENSRNDTVEKNDAHTEPSVEAENDIIIDSDIEEDKDNSKTKKRKTNNDKTRKVDKKATKQPTEDSRKGKNKNAEKAAVTHDASEEDFLTEQIENDQHDGVKKLGRGKRNAARKVKEQEPVGKTKRITRQKRKNN